MIPRMLVPLLSALLLIPQPQPQLSLSVIGLPEGEVPPLTLQKPGGSSEKITSWKEVRLSQAGKYTLSGPAFRSQSPIVDTIFEAAPAALDWNGKQSATLTLTYSPRGGTGRLYIAAPRTRDDDDFTVGLVRVFTPAEREGAVTLTAGRFIQQGPRLSYGMVGPDSSFYFAEAWDRETIVRLSPADFAKGAKGSAVAGTSPVNMALDSSGHVWLHKENEAVKHPVSSLLRGFTQTPAVRLTRDEENENPTSFTSLVFDAEGGMILYGPGSFMWIAPSELKQSRSIAPRWRSANTGSLHQAAFDQEGSLWVADENGQVLKISASDLKGSGDLNPVEYPVAQSVCGVALDNSGAVWALVRYTGDVYRKKADEESFQKIGSVGTGLDEGSRLVFNPPPAWSPLAVGMPGRLAEPK